MTHSSNTDTNATSEHFQTFLQKALETQPNHNVTLLEKAFQFAVEAHHDQFRKSGQPYIEHALEVATILIDLHQDTTTLAAGLLHDTVGHGTATLEQIETHFDNRIMGLVDGVTKIGDLTFQSREAEQAENFRKMFLSMVHDLRVILIKFADRLHNMRTLDVLPLETQKRMAQESLDIYAPLAHRLGVARIRWELEDLSLKWLDPISYRSIQEKIYHKRREREAYIEEVHAPLQKALHDAGIRAEITGRPKNFYSIHKKMQTREKEFEDLYDLLAIRILVDTIPECYHVLGLVHSMYTPIMSRLKDFIANPKSNRYQSLHTTVVGPRNIMLEVQLRTHEMHETAEVGIAAHWLYKEGKSKGSDLDQHMAWLRSVLEWQKETSDPQEFIEELKVDLFQHEIYVLTPQGDLIELPEDATPVDFAFAVHTEVGHHCVGARVDNRQVPLSTPLLTGQSVEIDTSPHQRPHRDWLTFVKSPKARNATRRYLREEAFEQSIRLGQDMVDRELRRKRKKPKEETLSALAPEFHQPDLEHLYAAIGNGDVPMGKFINKLFPKARRSLGAIQEESRDKNKNALKIDGLRNLMIHYARCCNPIAGDPVVGIVTRGRGISVHRRDCTNLPNLLTDSERIVDMDWDTNAQETFTVTIQVNGHDRPRLLSDITETISGLNISIVGGNIGTQNGHFGNRFQIEVKDANHLDMLFSRLRNIANIISVHRLEDLPAS
ncbi:MAG: bifunctional (p)ppGpp synthetase/guanosine-3',5'-bis(diphosphate) 3'-pyrophosphohydrolase [Candidatus Latescibacteria bacterium]|nr:bifunctional (p)ppGpp synthetase/guanosine-3',5'-bis(diphosphate) 3'-pyrophosphohydrolase [Candidatus Latescibacterota bacterium]MBT5832509.1 bifunctional (p)ppGpp synthetase/guanosine-3',5'-bis(diphosphate) 3'-pyrophosphohydrolase [Candidatus Latescibacterota bacterium]